MKNGMGKIVGYINREHLQDTLAEALNRKSKEVIPAGENQGYQLGHSLGFQDGIKAAIQLLSDLPDDPKATEDRNRKAWHQIR